MKEILIMWIIFANNALTGVKLEMEGGDPINCLK